MTPDQHLLLLVGALGAVIGVGKLLMSDAKLTLRLVVGHTIVTGGLSLAGLSLLALIPGLAVTAQVGASCALAVVGTTYLTKLLDRLFLGKTSTPDTPTTP